MNDSDHHQQVDESKSLITRFQAHCPHFILTDCWPDMYGVCCLTSLNTTPASASSLLRGTRGTHSPCRPFLNPHHVWTVGCSQSAIHSLSRNGLSGAWILPPFNLR